MDDGGSCGVGVDREGTGGLGLGVFGTMVATAE